MRPSFHQVLLVVSLPLAASAQRREGAATAVEVKSEATPQVGAVELGEKQAQPVSTGAPVETSEQTLVEQALKRYERAIVPCIDQQHRAQWPTDHEAFTKCVCPHVVKWRLPKTTVERRQHRPLAKGKSGYSFSLDATGRPQLCRVWAGAAPPDDDASWLERARAALPPPAAPPSTGAAKATSGKGQPPATTPSRNP